jgi:hypothetical protein
MRERNYTFHTRPAALARMAMGGVPEGRRPRPKKRRRGTHAKRKARSSRVKTALKSPATSPGHFLCNVSLPGRRAHRALIYDVRALRLEIGPRRAESPLTAIPSV